MTENENLEKQIADDLSAVLKEAKEMGCKEVAYFRHIPLQNVETVVNALYEIQQYRAMERRLQNIYGECDGLLEKVVQHLENHENIELPDNIIKARLLTDEDVDKWEEYKVIGTIEEFKALKEKAEVKKPIPLDKLGEYHECPVCGKYAENSYGCKYLYCPNCGCKYDWSE